MSADSPRRLSRKGSTGHVVLPQPVSDPSIIESVAGFIHEVIPQAYSSVLPGDSSRESIAWARFEQADYNDASLFPDGGEDCDSTPPLLLVLGYSNGVQVWSIPSSGEAVEVLSWNQRVVRTLRFLPSPLPPSSSSSSSSYSHSSSPHTHPAHMDPFAHKRPLIAMVDNSGPPPHFSTCSFISLQGGDQVKSIKFKNPICDVLANRRSIVITFVERIAVFDALTLEDRLTITTCYPSPGVCPNPVALGSRWLAFADKRLVPWWRSVGGCDVDGAQGSYTAQVLHAAKTLGKGLRGLSGHVASHLGAASGAAPLATPTVNGEAGGAAAHATPGVVSVVDIQGNTSSNNGGWSNGGGGAGPAAGGALGEHIVAHFVAHLEPIVALAFDPSGMLLLTVDKRGHRFHLFRIQPHLSGSTMSEVQQLYTLYRGDTTARIQDVAFSCDSRWVAVSSLRGTTHLFPITPYGGSIGVRTHTTPHVVNKLSRFHRSAGLSAEMTSCGRNSPVPSLHDAGSTGTAAGVAAGPPLTPPLSQRHLQSHHHHGAVAAPVTVQPLAQLRRHYVTQATAGGGGSVGGAGGAAGDSDAAQVRVAACFAPARASLPPGLLMTGAGGGHPVTSSVVGGGGVMVGGGAMTSATGHRSKATDCIYVMSAPTGALVQYDVEPRHVQGVSKERISDDTAIELLVDAKAEWALMSPPLFQPVQPPLAASNPLLQRPPPPLAAAPVTHKPPPHQLDEHWLSQVEIVTHAGPHRRLWMGPQFTFKTYSLSSSDLDKDSVEVGTTPVQSNPINVPMRPPLLIESGSTSSLEQSPHLTEVYQNEFEFSLDHGESRLREDLADAMQESPSMPGRRWSVECGGVGGGGGGCQGHRRAVQGHPRSTVERRVNPLGTIIMVQPSSQSAVSSSANQLTARQTSTEHLIVVAAEACKRRDDVTKPANSLVSSNRVKEVAGDKVVDQVVDVGKAAPTNNKERRKNAKNERKTSNVDKPIISEKSIVDKSITSEKSIVDKSITSEKSTSDKLKTERKSSNVDKPIISEKSVGDKSIGDEKSINTSNKSKNVGKSIVDKLISDEKSINTSDKSKNVGKSIVDKSISDDKSKNVVKSIVDKSISDEKSINTSDKSKNVDKSISDEKSINTTDKSKNVAKLVDESTNDVEKAKSVDVDRSNVDKTRKIEKSIDTDRSSVRKSKIFEKSVNVDNGSISDGKSSSVMKSKKVEITVDEDKPISKDVEELIDVIVESEDRLTTVEIVDKSISIDELLLTVDDKLIADSVVEQEESRDKKQTEPDCEPNVVASRASKRRSKKKADVSEEEKNQRLEVENEVEIIVENEVVVENEVSDLENLSSIVDKSTPAVVETEVKDREYPSLTSTVKTKRKTRTLGKKISKVPKSSPCPKPTSDLDLLEESNQHSLLDFPDLLLANCVSTLVDKRRGSSIERCFEPIESFEKTESRELIENIDLECIDKAKRPESIEKSSVVEKRRESIAQVVIESIEKDNMKQDEEEGAVVVLVKVENSDKEETTDKDSSDEGLAKGGGGGKRKKRKKAGGVEQSEREMSDVAEKIEKEKSPPVVKLSWSQIASKNTTTTNNTVGEKEEEEVEDCEEGEGEGEEEVIQPEIISWQTAKSSSTAAATAEDRGSVYESCCESVEDGGETSTAAATAVADGSDQYRDCERTVAGECDLAAASVVDDQKRDYARSVAESAVENNCSDRYRDCERSVAEERDTAVVVDDDDQCGSCQQLQLQSSSGGDSSAASGGGGKEETQQPAAAKKSKKQRKKRR